MGIAQALAAGVVWVGGWGFLFCNYPKIVFQILRKEPTPKRLHRIRVMGAIELAIVYISALGTLILGFFQT
jgi:hypothetical protein